jgi:hypothetical protein
MSGFHSAAVAAALAWLTTTPAVAAPPAIDITQAKAAFAEAQAVSDKDGGRLWHKTLYGAMFFVDPDTRAVVANEPDPAGVLHAQDGVFVGTLPKDVIVSNAPVNWEGKRWTMLMWPTIPSDTITRRITFAHEIFHRIQPELSLAAPDSPNLQLDTVEGRLWLQLEWRALAAALVARGAAQTAAIRDALAFRSRRHTLFPGSAKTEASLEIAEGIPEYTGVVTGAPDRNSARWHAIGKLADPDQNISFVRFFAYISGPPYGLLLDQRLPGWRARLAVNSDVGALLESTLPPHATVSALTRAAYYGGAGSVSLKRHVRRKRKPRRCATGDVSSRVRRCCCPPARNLRSALIRAHWFPWAGRRRCIRHSTPLTNGALWT